MARFVRDPLRKNFTVQQRGKEYNQRLLLRSQTIFSTLLGLLPSNYKSTVQGPNYTLELKAVAVELGKLELALEDVDSDQGYATTRSEFLYSIVGYLLLTNGKLPTVPFDDVQFRQFFLSLIKIYFQGSIPDSIEDAVKLFIEGDVTVTENFLLIRKGASGYDISDQFGFQIDIPSINGGFPSNIFEVDSSLRMILDIIRPAHTLYRIRYVFSDEYLPNDTVGKILDASRWVLRSYFYDDGRSNWHGIRLRDRLGRKVNQNVLEEDHSVYPLGYPPVITSVNPPHLFGSGSITITGSRFVQGATVTVAGIPCTNVVVVSGTTITCTTPALPGPDAVEIQVTNPNGQYGRYFPFVLDGFLVVLAASGSPGDSITLTHDFTLPPIVYIIKQVGSVWADITGLIDVSHNLAFTTVTVTNTTNAPVTLMIRLI